MPQNKIIQEETEQPAVSKCNEAEQLTPTLFLYAKCEGSTNNEACLPLAYTELQNILLHERWPDADVNVPMVMFEDWMH